MVVVGIRFDDVEVKVVGGSFHVKRHEYRGRRGKFQLQDKRLIKFTKIDIRL